jgi:hypothetical protein
LPSEAAYFGVKTGNEYATLVKFEELGDIIIMGYMDDRDAKYFALPGTQFGLLYAKTNYALMYEMMLRIPYPDYYYFSQRFIRPKKFNNNHGITFTYDSLSNGELSTSTVAATLYTSYPINEVFHIPYTGFNTLPTWLTSFSYT